MLTQFSGASTPEEARVISASDWPVLVNLSILCQEHRTKTLPQKGLGRGSTLESYLKCKLPATPLHQAARRRIPKNEDTCLERQLFRHSSIPDAAAKSLEFVVNQLQRKYRMMPGPNEGD
jgi:hypothetical protein